MRMRIQTLQMMWRIVSIIMFCVLQWNARSLIKNGLELKKFVDKLEIEPELICIQETWLKPSLDFVIPGYECLRLDRA